MKKVLYLSLLAVLISCNTTNPEMKKVIFLHRSTGLNIFMGKTNPYVYKYAKINEVIPFFRKYNRENKTEYSIRELHFASPESKKNNPYDYYNVWVKHAGNEPFMNVPTLEMLTRDYDIIVFKHCYSASNISEDTGNPDIESEDKRLENYKLHYEALKQKMHQFPDTRFIVWTPAVNVKNLFLEGEAERTFEFYKWIVNTWDEKGDNIILWDFYKYETEGGLFFRDEYAVSPNDSHPGKEFSSHMSSVFSKFVIDVAEGKIN